MSNADNNNAGGDPAENGSAPKPLDFIRKAVADDTASGRFGGKVVTRFPPEPNAYLHIGHAKAIWIDYGMARSSAACSTCASTTPTPPRKSRSTSTPSSRTCAGWAPTGSDRLFFASDYFEQMYEWAVDLIRKGKAYVCDLSADEVARTAAR